MGTTSVLGDQMMRKKGIKYISKEEFIGENSFKSWSNYMRALKEIPKRLINRILSRSQDEYELHEVKGRSQYEMMKILDGWDLIWFGVGSLIGAGIFVLTGIQAKRHAGPAVVLSFLIAGFSAMLSLLCYVEFAVEIPVAGMITVLLVNAIGQARYLTHIARTHMLPPWFAHVNKSFGTPVNATVVMLLITAIIALFTDLIVLSNLLSISTLVIFLMVPLALLVRRYYSANETTNTNLITLLFCIAFIFCSAIVSVVLWNRKDSNWKGYVVTLSIWFISTLGLKVFVPQARYPKAWGVPFMPWVASASIFINIFLLGSIDKDSFVRFGIWTIILIIYYLLFGLHASYDISKAMEEKQVQDDHHITTMEQGDS